MAAECILIDLKDTKILVNYPLEAKNLINLDDVDILIGTDVTNCIGLLYCNPNFKAKIYLTQPVKEFLQLLSEEIHHENQIAFSHFENSNQNDDKSMFTNYKMSQGSFGKISKRIYSLNYRQHVKYYNLFTFIPYNSGYEVGGCYWKIECNEVKLCILGSSSDSSAGKDGIFGNILSPLDLSGLTRINQLIVLREPSKVSFSSNDYSEGIVRTVSKINSLLCNKNCEIKASVIPIFSMNRIFFDFLEAFSNFFPKLQICIIGETAKTSLENIGILTEWLHLNMQEFAQLQAKRPFKFSYSPNIRIYKEFNQKFGEDLAKNKTTPFVLFCPSPFNDNPGTFGLIKNFFPGSKHRNHLVNFKKDSCFLVDEREYDFIYLDQHLSLKSLCDIVKNCCTNNPKLSIINVSFDHKYFSISNQIYHLNSEIKSISIPLSNMSILGNADIEVIHLFFNL